MSSDDHAADKAVGYGKPPAHGQFRPGQSGNKKGRPKGSRSLKSDLREELDELVSARENGRDIWITKQRLLIKTLLSRALKNDTRAVNAILSLCLKLYVGDNVAADAGGSAADDQRILNEYIEKEISRRSKIQQPENESNTNDENLNDFQTEE
jgi:hypothetical protein